MGVVHVCNNLVFTRDSVRREVNINFIRSCRMNKWEEVTLKRTVSDVNRVNG